MPYLFNPFTSLGLFRWANICCIVCPVLPYLTSGLTRTADFRVELYPFPAVLSSRESPLTRMACTS